MWEKVAGPQNKIACRHEIVQEIASLELAEMESINWCAFVMTVLTRKVPWREVDGLHNPPVLELNLNSVSSKALAHLCQCGKILHTEW